MTNKSKACWATGNRNHDFEKIQVSIFSFLKTREIHCEYAKLHLSLNSWSQVAATTNAFPCVASGGDRGSGEPTNQAAGRQLQSGLLVKLKAEKFVKRQRRFFFEPLRLRHLPYPRSARQRRTLRVCLTSPTSQPYTLYHRSFFGPHCFFPDEKTFSSINVLRLQQRRTLLRFFFWRTRCYAQSALLLRIASLCAFLH